MNAPADRTAKRISAQEWFARVGAIDLLKLNLQKTQPQMRVPADRTALRT
jgi:hypothetical protein